MTTDEVATKVNLIDAFSRIQEHWQPHIVAELNGQHVKLAKFLGEFDMHHHANEDEMFLVLSGSIEMQMKDHTVTIEEGEFFVVPRGVDHKPIAKEEACVVLFEPAGTLNTGNVESEKTVRDPRVLEME